MKPITVRRCTPKRQAMLYDGRAKTAAKIMEFCGEMASFDREHHALSVQTEHGLRYVHAGTWVVADPYPDEKGIVHFEIHSSEGFDALFERIPSPADLHAQAFERFVVSR